MKWKYKNEDFKSLPFDFVNGSLRKSKCVEKELPYMPGCFVYLVYVPKWDRCYWLHGLNYSGNSITRLKAYLVDPYTDNYLYIEVKNLEIVVKDAS